MKFALFLVLIVVFFMGLAVALWDLLFDSGNFLDDLEKANRAHLER